MEGSKGYTLMELVVVLALIGLMLIVSIPRFRQTLLTDSLNSTARKIVGQVKTLKNRTIREQKTGFFHFDLMEQRYWVTTESDNETLLASARENAYQVPSSVRISDVWSQSHGKKSEGEVLVRFNKKGYVEPVIIHLESDDKKMSLVLNPFLGTIKIYEKYIDMHRDDSNST